MLSLLHSNISDSSKRSSKHPFESQHGLNLIVSWLGALPCTPRVFLKWHGHIWVWEKKGKPKARVWGLFLATA